MAMGFRGFDIAMSGLRYNERALSVTSHNISNVNTDGYVRQQAIATTAHYDNIAGNLQIGLGTDIEQIRQIRNSFMDNVYRQEVATLGYWETRDKTIDDVQSILGEPMWDGMQTYMNSFWDSWQELAKQPDSLTTRALVRQRGEALVHQVNHIGEQIDKLQEDLDKELKVRISEVNLLTKSIAAINVEILKGEIAGDNANDFRDQRNTYLDKLSKLINIETIEKQDGQIDVTSTGYYLVSRGTNTEIYAGRNLESGLFSLPMLEGTTQVIPFNNGKIRGLIEARGEVEGVKSSVENGAPNNKADITFVIDNSDTSVQNINKIQSKIANYVEDLNKRGIEYNVRLITYNSAATASVDYGSDYESFIAAVNGVTPNMGDTGNDFSNVITELSAVGNYDEIANKYAIVFTGESIDGDGTAAVADPPTTYIDALNAMNMNTSIVTDSDYFTVGDGGVGETTGWNKITKGTDGKLFDINSVDLDKLFIDINDEINSDVNHEMSDIEDSLNIIPAVTSRLNSILNVVAREINYAQKNGYTMGNNSTVGQDFFVAINKDLPIMMGNIKLNDNLTELHNIVAGNSGANGDNKIAIEIANLRNKKLLKDENGVISSDEYYQTVILKVGSLGAESENISENQRKLVESSDNLRKSIMSVSIDEEVANMLKYKFAYGASARLLSVMDDMLESVVNRLGLVGR